MKDMKKGDIDWEKINEVNNGKELNSVPENNASYSIVDDYAEYELSNTAEIPLPVEDFVEPVPEAKNYKNIVDLVSNTKLKKPALFFKNVPIFNKDLITESTVKISLAPLAGRNAYHLYINIDDNYYGKITPEGKYFYSNYQIYAPIDEKVIRKFLDSIKDDPRQAVLESGRKTGICSCCGALLTDPKSVELGIGPVCADTWGF